MWNGGKKHFFLHRPLVFVLEFFSRKPLRCGFTIPAMGGVFSARCGCAAVCCRYDRLEKRFYKKSFIRRCNNRRYGGCFVAFATLRFCRAEARNFPSDGYFL